MNESGQRCGQGSGLVVLFDPRVLTVSVEIGTSEEAQVAASMFVDPPSGDTLAGWRVIGAGKERTAYLSPTGIVYKAGSEVTAVAEHDRFAQLLEGDMAEHIPPHALYRFTIASRQGEVQTVGVIAMPYLPNDDSVDLNAVRIYDLVAATGDFNPGNVHANGGRLWLIDGAGLPGLRDWGR